MRRHPRRAAVDPSNPRSWGTDDRSGFVGNHKNLMWQFEWAGTQLINKQILVYADQYDTPQRQLGTIIISADPEPVMNARPEQYPIDEVWPMMMELAMAHGSIPIYTEETTNDSQHDLGLALEISTI